MRVVKPLKLCLRPLDQRSCLPVFFDLSMPPLLR